MAHALDRLCVRVTDPGGYFVHDGTAESKTNSIVQKGDRVGLLLDCKLTNNASQRAFHVNVMSLSLDVPLTQCKCLAHAVEVGSMTMSRNGKRVGVMQASGLSGEYVWAAVFMEPRQSVRIAGTSETNPTPEPQPEPEPEI
jgi:hypothetical protein